MAELKSCQRPQEVLPLLYDRGTYLRKKSEKTVAVIPLLPVAHCSHTMTYFRKVGRGPNSR